MSFKSHMPTINVIHAARLKRLRSRSSSLTGLIIEPFLGSIIVFAEPKKKSWSHQKHIRILFEGTTETQKVCQGNSFCLIADYTFRNNTKQNKEHVKLMQRTTSQPPQPPQKFTKHHKMCMTRDLRTANTNKSVVQVAPIALQREARHSAPRANPAEKHPLAEPIKTPNSRTPLTMPLSTHESLGLPFLWTCWMKVKCYEIDSIFFFFFGEKNCGITKKLMYSKTEQQNKNRTVFFCRCTLCPLSALCMVYVVYCCCNGWTNVCYG